MVLWTMAFILMVDTFLIFYLFFLVKQNVRRYIRLEEWAEDWLKRLEQKHEALECRAVNAAARIAETERKAEEIRELFPKDGKGEMIRNQALLRQMNDEMERGLKMEKEWNDGVASILNYGKPITDEVKTDE